MSNLDLIAPDSPEAALSRRSLVQTIAGTALAMTFLAGCGGSDDDNGNNNNNGGSTNVDQAVLQFALHLEYLEAEFYSYAVTGQGLPANLFTGLGTQGATTGGVKTNFTSQYGLAIATEIARDEIEHVKAIRSLLGQNVIAKPAININPLGLTLTQEADFVTLARAFEDVGVTAYNGAATLISKSVLAYASSILAVEALHTGNLRFQAIMLGTTGPKLDGKDETPNSADPLTGNGDNFFATTSPATIAPTPGQDVPALAFKRTPTEVLRIVLSQPNATSAQIGANPKGGFFPGGLNLSGNNAATLLSVK